MENLYNTQTQSTSESIEGTINITSHIGFTESHVVKTTTIVVTYKKDPFDGFPHFINGCWVPGSRMNTDMI